MSLGLQLILSTSLVASPAACSWAHPGANPYRGDPVRALADFDLPSTTRTKLRTLMSAHRYTDVSTITRDDIVGDHGYANLREMHSGHGQVCHGEVDRSAWSAMRRERGLVYCADDACVLVPVICNNVSLVSRKPDHPAVLDDSPIDISPAAGPPSGNPPASAAPPDTDVAGLLPPPVLDGNLPAPPDAPAGGGSGAGGGGGSAVPWGGYTIGGGGLPCCGSEPIVPIVPTSPPPVSAIPEVPTSWLMIAGLAAIAAWRRRSG